MYLKLDSQFSTLSTIIISILECISMFYANIEIYSLVTICHLLYCIFITKSVFTVGVIIKGLQRLTFARDIVIQEANDHCCGKYITEKLLAIKHLTHDIISHLIVVQTSEMI